MRRALHPSLPPTPTTMAQFLLLNLKKQLHPRGRAPPHRLPLAVVLSVRRTCDRFSGVLPHFTAFAFLVFGDTPRAIIVGEGEFHCVRVAPVHRSSST